MIGSGFQALCAAEIRLGKVYLAKSLVQTAARREKLPEIFVSLLGNRHLLDQTNRIIVFKQRPVIFLLVPAAETVGTSEVAQRLDVGIHAVLRVFPCGIHIAGGTAVSVRRFACLVESFLTHAHGKPMGTVEGIAQSVGQVGVIKHIDGFGEIGLHRLEITQLTIGVGAVFEHDRYDDLAALILLFQSEGACDVGNIAFVIPQTVLNAAQRIETGCQLVARGVGIQFLDRKSVV